MTQDAAENGHGGDGETQPEKEAVARWVDRRCEHRGGQVSQSNADRQRHGDGGDGDGDDGAAITPAAQMSELKIHSDLEHQQNQSDLTDDADGRRSVVPEQRVQRVWEEVSDQGGPKDQPGEDFPDDAGLAQPAKHRVQVTRSPDHHDQLQQSVEQ